jgi:hypothetical protein
VTCITKQKDSHNLIFLWTHRRVVPGLKQEEKTSKNTHISESLSWIRKLTLLRFSSCSAILTTINHSDQQISRSMKYRTSLLILKKSSVSVAQPEEPSAVSCDTVESTLGHVSEPVDAPVVEPFENTTNAPSQPTDLPIKSEPLQPADDIQVTQQLKFGPYSDRYYPHHQSYRLSRDTLREIAAATLDALDDGFYYPPATKDADLIDAERDGKETEGDGGKEEESREEEGAESKKDDKESESQDGTDEKAQVPVEMEVGIVDYRKAGKGTLRPQNEDLVHERTHSIYCA